MKKPKKNRSIIGTIGLGIAIGAVTAIVLAMLFAKLCESGLVKEKLIVPSAMLSIAIAAFASALYTGKNANKLKFPAAIVVGTVELIICFLSHAALIQTSFCNVLFICTAVMLPSCLGGLLSVRKNKKHKFA